MLVDPNNVPVFINNRDRLHAMRQMIDWLLSAGTKRIEILDNDSTYPRLLEYYGGLPAGVRVTFLGENLGPWAFWDKKMHLKQDIPYVVTDADIAPVDECPKDLINRLTVLLHDNPKSDKVGPGLLVPGLFDSLSGTGSDWERKFWTNRHSNEAFFAPIDTTFALYGAGSPSCNHDNNLRMDWPYVVRHTPSYADMYINPEEESYYITHRKQCWSHVGY